MNKINMQIFEKLIKKEPKSPAVTIYMPTHNTSDNPSITEDITRLKNLSSKVIEELEKSDKTSDFAKEFKENISTIQEDRNYWKDTKSSLLILAAPGVFETYHLPIDSEEYYSVNDHFYISPILGMAQEFEPFYLLNITAKDPTLYKVDAYDMKKYDIGLPTSVEDALNIDEMHLRSLQHSSIDSPSGAQYHGHGAGKDTGEDEKLKFMSIVDNMIKDKLDHSVPLMLAGADKELAMYKSVCSYPNVMQNEIQADFNEHDIRGMHKLAMTKMRNEVDRTMYDKLLITFDEQRGNSKLSMIKLKNIDIAASEGRVGTLLVSMRRFTRDSVRDNAGKVQMLTFFKDKESRLIDDIARKVVSHGGQLINLYESRMPEKLKIASINRY